MWYKEGDVMKYLNDGNGDIKNKKVRGCLWKDKLLKDEKEYQVLSNLPGE